MPFFSPLLANVYLIPSATFFVTKQLDIQVAVQIIEERNEVAQESEAALESLQGEADSAATQAALKAAKELETQLATAKNEEEAKAAKDKFTAEINKSQAQLSAAKEQKQSTLNARLQAKRKALEEKQKSMVLANSEDGGAAAEVLRRQRTLRDSAARSMMAGFKTKQALAAEREQMMAERERALVELQAKHEAERKAQEAKVSKGVMAT
eukprot:SAG31_NODE_2434_length_5705_cov_6.754014_4_plen_210_part_00